ncbi:hypothetical protein IRJ41_002667 [Triplophysa rosa]|uniref:Uncharacterized protein n=1 Tax=Triplophysa rosa TaxID=992332 RepID=A0A9W7W993_TRIRA|nr:hypothetical protein IRJ41_002667 [Triplophysa rosa]
MGRDGIKPKDGGIWSAGVWEDGDVHYKEHPLRNKILRCYTSMTKLRNQMTTDQPDA